MRGQGYLSLGKADEAAGEFQKIVDHPRIMYADPIGALAHLQLGRALVLSGEKEKPRAPIRNSSNSGAMPTPTSRFSSQGGIRKIISDVCASYNGLQQFRNCVETRSRDGHYAYSSGTAKNGSFRGNGLDHGLAGNRD